MPRRLLAAGLLALSGAQDICEGSLEMRAADVNCEGDPVGTFGATRRTHNLTHDAFMYFALQFGASTMRYRLTLPLQRGLRAACVGFRDSAIDAEMGGRSTKRLAEQRVRATASQALRELGVSEALEAELMEPLRSGAGGGAASLEPVLFDGVDDVMTTTAKLIALHAGLLLQALGALGAKSGQEPPTPSYVLSDFVWAAFYAQVMHGFHACYAYRRRFSDEEWRVMSPGVISRTHECAHPNEFSQTSVSPRWLYHATGAKAHRHTVVELLRCFGERANFLEIGVNDAATGSHVLRQLPKAGYLGVDVWREGTPWFEMYEVAKANVAPYPDRSRLFRGSIREFAETPDSEFHRNVRPFDVVWIDGDHELFAVQEDMSFAGSFMLPSSIMAGHDFTPWNFDVILAVWRSANLFRISQVHVASDMTFWYQMQPSGS